jgi:hypothetical protein
MESRLCQINLIFNTVAPSNMNQHDSEGKVVIIGAGASYETRKSENSFNVGVLDLETGNGKVQFYKYLGLENRWTKNTDVNLDEDDDGRFPFVIPSLQGKIEKEKRESLGLDEGKSYYQRFSSEYIGRKENIRSCAKIFK